MEDNAPLVFGDLNKNICQECGLSLKIYSYEKINPNAENENIKIKLYCQNLEHKKITEFTFEEYKYFIDEKLDKVCKCFFCNKMFLNTNDICYYCYDCRKALCSDCLNEKHEKEHRNIFKYEDLDNKCLIHSDKNEIQYYCIICKRPMCTKCLVENFEHSKEHDVKEISKLLENEALTSKIRTIEQEQRQNTKYKQELMKKIKELDSKITFNDYLLNEQNNYFHLFLDYNDKNINSKENNKIKINNNNNNNNNKKNMNDNIINENNINNNIINNVNNNDKIKNNDLEKDGIDGKIKIRPKEDDYEIETPMGSKNYIDIINIIYHDENIKFEGMDIIKDCQVIQSNTKGSLILTNNLPNLNSLLKKFVETNIKSKFILIVNGSSADHTINFIKNTQYKNLFIGSIIYTSNLNKYSKIKDKYSDFIDIICIDPMSIVKFIKKKFSDYNSTNENELLNHNQIINIYTFNMIYFPLYEEICKFYGDETEKTFSMNYSALEDFVKNQPFTKDEKNSLLKNCKIFSEITKKNYNQIIINYLKDDYFYKILNALLKKKDIFIYKKIGYFAGNLMHSIVQYGKINYKGIESGATFYKGMALNLIDTLEYLKNRCSQIAFPYFFTLSTKKQLAEIMSKRKLSEKERKNKEIYSVILKIDYLYDDGYEPCVIDLKELAQYPDEEDYILLPFTFLYMRKFKMDSNKYTVDIEFDIIGKKEILEYKIKELKKLYFDNKSMIMIAK